MESVNNKQNEFVRQVAEQKYEFGFTTAYGHNRHGT